MSQLGKAIKTILNADGATSAIIGTRVYPLVAAQGKAMPFVAYSIVGNNAHSSKNGVSSVDQLRVQLDLVTDGTQSGSGGYGQLMDLSDAVRAALDRYPHGTVAGVTLDGVEWFDEENKYEEDINAYRHIQEYYFRVKY